MRTVADTKSDAYKAGMEVGLAIGDPKSNPFVVNGELKEGHHIDERNDWNAGYNDGSYHANEKHIATVTNPMYVQGVNDATEGKVATLNTDEYKAGYDSVKATA